MPRSSSMKPKKNGAKSKVVRRYQGKDQQFEGGGGDSKKGNGMF